MSWLTELYAHDRHDHVAIVADEGSVTYAQLRDRVSRAAGWLASRGVEPGDVVALQLPRSLAFLELHLAALGMGAATLPLNTAYPDRELRYYLADSAARLAIVLPDHVDGLDAPAQVLGADADLRTALNAAPSMDLPDRLPDETLAVLLYTSGTTGQPKGAMLTHANVRATVDALVQAWRWSPDDVLLHALPLFHVHGLFVAQHAALRAGATSLWEAHFDAQRTLARLERDSVTVFMGVPTLYSRLLALPERVTADLSSMRLFTSGSAPLPARDHQAFEARTGHRILERYGMTEVGIVLSNPYQGERRPGSVGFPVPGAKIRIVSDSGEPCAADQVGEIQIAGPSVFQGYLNKPDKTAETLVDGWVRSGDLGYVDADGYVHIVGRSKDMILSGGLNVYPAEVERVLLEHPSIDEAAVVGVADPDLGERVVAEVVLAAGHTLDVPSLLEWCRERLAPYKCPKAVRCRAALPRNAMGKVQKAQLRVDWAQLRCRRSTPGDLDTLTSWNIAMARETESVVLDPPTVRRGVARALSGSVGAWYVLAEVADQVVGQCMVTTEWSDWRNREVWWFQSVYVAPQWRGRGVFRAIYEHVVAAAEVEGAGGVRLYVDRRNTRAQRVYSALGMNGEHYAVFEAMFDEPPSE